MIELMTNFPKVHCPFIRQRITKKRYLVTEEVNPGYEWVFDDPDTFAVEKLDGTNVKVKTEGGKIVAIQNRKTPIEMGSMDKGHLYITLQRRIQYRLCYV